jgi:hypothetical protein
MSTPANARLGANPLLGAFQHPLICLASIALSLTAILRWVFFHFSARIWAAGELVRPEEITSWARPYILERDGAEPQVLLFLVMILIALVMLVMRLTRQQPSWRKVVVPLAVVVAAFFGFRALPRMPEVEIYTGRWHVVAAITGVLLVAAAAWWVSKRKGAFLVFAAVLLPVCFLAANLPSHSDLACILTPALRLRLGTPPAQIYFQYDYLPSLLAVGWHSLGGDPLSFIFCSQVSYYLLLLGGFLLARKMFADPRLAGLLLVFLCVVRIYAVSSDASALPQVTPLRLDLWLPLLALAWRFGLRHWSVGLAAALILFFSRSFGVLYLGAYPLAIACAFLTYRVTASQPPPLRKDLAALARQLTPAAFFIGAALLALHLVFGAVVSDAMIIYRRLGVGMLRISPTSFYWWIMPMLAAVVWLGFSLREDIGETKFQAALFLVALALANSIYFFGRSHEHNLINISPSLLFCAFLGLDLAILACRPDPRWVTWSLHAAPFAALACAAYFYSGRLDQKLHVQLNTLLWHKPLPQYFDPGPIDCREIASVAGSPKVFVYSQFDYWYYEQCGYVPQGYMQPLQLQPVRSEVIGLLNQLLGAGYKVVVPKHPGYYNFDFAETEASLPALEKTETANYRFYWRKSSDPPRLSGPASN